MAAQQEKEGGGTGGARGAGESGTGWEHEEAAAAEQTAQLAPCCCSPAPGCSLRPTSRSTAEAVRPGPSHLRAGGQADGAAARAAQLPRAAAAGMCVGGVGSGSGGQGCVAGEGGDHGQAVAALIHGHLLVGE